MLISQLNSELKTIVPKCSLSQCIQIVMPLLKGMYPHETYERLYRRLTFKGNPSLSFAKSELSSVVFIETDSGTNVELMLNFLGLFGAASPLPAHYCEMVLESADNDGELRAFLDLFNHHLQRMVYPIWKKQRYYLVHQRDLSDKFSKYMLSILGMYSDTQLKSSGLDFQKLLPYIGLLSMKQKSAGTLLAILRHYLEHDDLEIVQCIRMKSEIPSWQRFALGEKNCSLGSDLLVGESVVNNGAKFQILLKNVSWNGLYVYSLHGKKMKELEALIDLALNEPLEYELCLEVNKSEVKPFVLSQHYLGVNSFLSSTSENTKIILSH